MSEDREGWADPTAEAGGLRPRISIIGTESVLAGEETPAADTDLMALPHIRNPIGAANEQWVRAMSAMSPAEVLDRFRDITARRAQMLAEMTQADFDAPSWWAPAGPATYGRMMRIRAYDCWMHEQDIRDALGMPGNQDGPAAWLSVEEAADFLGYVIGARAEAPGGTTVLFDLTGPVHRQLAVAVNGRAVRVDKLEESATVTLRMSSQSFMRRFAGRTDGADRTGVEVEGNAELADRILANLTVTP